VSRKRLDDYLQSHLFWAFDATQSNGIPVFNPLFGFSRITSPEINLEVEQFKDGTFLYNRSVVKAGSASSVMFERAASMFDSDFYDWIILALHGNKDFEAAGTLGKIASFGANALTGGGRSNPRRSLLIIQFTRINMSDPSPVNAVNGVAAAAAIGGILGSSVSGALTGGGLAAAFMFGLGPFEFAKRLPGRAWLLHDCLPLRYKSASDFDANSGQVSMQEIEVQPEYIEEYSLGIKP